MEVNIKYLQFRHPFTCMVAGPTGSGKTVLVRKLLKNHQHLIDLNVKSLSLIWCYGQWQSLYNENIPNVSAKYVKGLPSKEDILNNKPHLIVIDDLMTELGDNKELSNLFTKVSHHLEISVMFISQNLFYKGSQIRTISLNCQYIILMKNPRDKLQINCLAKQLYPNNSKFFMEAYEDATKGGYGYLKIDLKQDTPEFLRVQSKVIPEEKPKDINSVFAPTIYTPKSINVSDITHLNYRDVSKSA